MKLEYKHSIILTLLLLAQMLMACNDNAKNTEIALVSDDAVNIGYGGEMDMAMSILLQSLNVSEEVLRQERAKSIAAVKRTNGQLRLEQKLRELESEAWQAVRF